mmetsp:Transcript_39064/g.87385  ORF Transcript_39064/g.87385 Transcript_39064/m.87385 type:complete len:278 (-) Transcript_39064:57-890(-)
MKSAVVPSSAAKSAAAPPCSSAAATKEKPRAPAYSSGEAPRESRASTCAPAPKSTETAAARAPSPLPPLPPLFSPFSPPFSPTVPSAPAIKWSAVAPVSKSEAPQILGANRPPRPPPEICGRSLERSAKPRRSSWTAAPATSEATRVWPARAASKSGVRPCPGPTRVAKAAAKAAASFMAAETSPPLLPTAGPSPPPPASLEPSVSEGAGNEPTAASTAASRPRWQHRASLRPSDDEEEEEEGEVMREGTALHLTAPSEASRSRAEICSRAACFKSE